MKPPFDNPNDVIQFDLNGDFIKEWKSASFAAKQLGLRQSGIASNAAGTYKSSGGYIWEYKNKKNE